MPSADAVFRRLRAASGDRARALAADAIAALSKRPKPAARELDLLVGNANLLANLGAAEPCIALVKTWRKRGVKSDALDFAEAVLVVSSDPAAASARLRELALGDPRTASMFVTNAVLRGDLSAALAAARRHDFEFGRDGWIGTSYALWALVLMDCFDEAEQVVDALKRRRVKAPEQRLHALRAEATVASYRCQYAREERLLEEAHALCRSAELAQEAAFVEVSLAASRARSGDSAGAQALIERWTTASGSAALDAYREIAKMDLHVLERRRRAAERAALSALAFAQASENRMLECHLCFCLAVVADARRFARALETFRRLTHRHQVPYYARRLRVIEQLIVDGMTSIAGVELVERSRHERLRLPLARLWTPRQIAVGADLYYDRVLGIAHVAGSGPYSLAEHPILRRMLEVLLAADRMSVALEDLFRAVWQIPFDPLVHETKCHVTLHRLRRWLGEHGAAQGLIELSDGRVSVGAPFDVRVVELGPIAMSQEPLADRILACLGAQSPLAPRELEHKLGVSRAALAAALQGLLKTRRVARLGAGAAVRYSVT